MFYYLLFYYILVTKYIDYENTMNIHELEKWSYENPKKSIPLWLVLVASVAVWVILMDKQKNSRDAISRENDLAAASSFDRHIVQWWQAICTTWWRYNAETYIIDSWNIEWINSGNTRNLIIQVDKNTRRILSYQPSNCKLIEKEVE